MLSAPVLAAEYIESFHSDIEVQRNGDLEVTETIRVKAEGKEIRRGIYRDFPTRYKDARGRNLTVGFELLSVKRDDRPETFQTRNQSNGIRVYIGDSNVYLDPGFYDYQIRYRSSRQLGFFDDFDELYWNVTGTGWSFEIREASAHLILPDTASNLSLTGYTGPQGSSEQALDFRRIGDSQAYFQTTQVLARYEGMTIVAGWPKGLVQEPSAAQQRAWFIADNNSAIIVAGGTLLLLIYYLLLWRWLGRDPPAGIIVPRYRAPAGYSPASVRFIERMGYDKTCFTTAIINLAIKGALEINDDDGDFQLTRTGPAGSPLAAGESQVLEGLFKGGLNHISIKRSNHSLLSQAIDKHKRSLKRDYEKKHFATNSWLIVPGALASLALITAAIANLPSEDVIFKTIFLGAFTLAPLMLVYKAVSRVLRMGKNGIVRYGIFMLPMFIFMWLLFSFGFPYMELARDVPMALVAGLVAMLALHYFFYQWLKAPTLAGRRLLDQIEGFRHYLEVAEEDELALQGAPHFSSDIYETWLPYAIAFDLENEWSAKLNNAIAAGTVEQSYSHPRWYHGHSRPSRHFSSSLANSFNSAIASSSIAPGSSSGSSGGSSGGGGGGGGGGGW
ncbi:MAG: DUF2207 domain-containing protein [Gammaproteobacteria bacterium]|nr:DUF2207 domain-containing protein [Gammaproteobacteria bacterium]